jgi:hypothetical protein
VFGFHCDFEKCHEKMMYLFPVALLTACDRVAEEQYRHVISKAGAAEYLESLRQV